MMFLELTCLACGAHFDLAFKVSYSGPVQCLECRCVSVLLKKITTEGEKKETPREMPPMLGDPRGALKRIFWQD